MYQGRLISLLLLFYVSWSFDQYVVTVLRIMVVWSVCYYCFMYHGRLISLLLLFYAS